MSKIFSLSGTSLFILATIYLASIGYLGFYPIQSDFIGIIIPYSICFCIYLLLVFKVDLIKHLTPLLCLAVLCRFILLFSFPNLSDDIYRFLWDANLVLDGQNPYLLLPDDIINSNTQDLYDKLNSPSYYSPYPPVAQIIYSISAFISGGDLNVFSGVIKLFTLLAELGSLYFMIRILETLHMQRSRVLIYALNPLIIIELMGNLHFESFMVFFMICSTYYLIRDGLIKSAFAFILAVASKLLPLMFTPFIIAYLGVKKSVKYLLITGATLLLLFIPIIVGVINGTFLSSVGLYFQKFEFNASLYYLLREIGFLIYGWNIIAILGPFLGLFTLGTICWVWYIRRHKINKENIFLYLLFTISLYLFTATTIHPWYVALPVAFCLFTDFRFPVIWSGLIFFTYFNYSHDTYYESLLIVLIEYIIVYSIVFLELKKFKTKKASLN